LNLIECLPCNWSEDEEDKQTRNPIHELVR
jgi:hypothetical protein